MHPYRTLLQNPDPALRLSSSFQCERSWSGWQWQALKIQTWTLIRDALGSSCHLKAHCINTDAPPSFPELIYTFMRRANAMLLQMLETDKRVLVNFGPNQTNSVACVHNMSNSFYSVLKTQRLTCLSGSTEKLESPWSDILRYGDLARKNQTNKKRNTGNMNMHISHFFS